MFSVSIDPDDGLNAWPSFTYVLAVSLRWQSGDLSLFNPTVVGFWWGMPFLDGENRPIKGPDDFLLEISLISHWLSSDSAGEFRAEIVVRLAVISAMNIQSKRLMRIGLPGRPISDRKYDDYMKH